MREYKGISKLECIEDYCVIDIETTGLDPCMDEIIEIGAIKVRGDKVVDSFSELIKPDRPISPFITSLTGISNEMVADARKINEVLVSFKDFITNDVLIGHNVNFDINFLYDDFEYYNQYHLTNDFIDTMRFSRRVFKELENHRLSTLAEFFSIETNNMHRALNDCFVTMNCYEKIKSYIVTNNIDIVQLLQRKQVKLKAKDIKPDNIDVDIDNYFYDKECVFTGSLNVSRREAMKMVVNVGGKCSDNITKKTNCLIVGNLEYTANIKDGKSAKLKKAEDMILKGCDIEILSENVFNDLLNKDKV